MELKALLESAKELAVSISSDSALASTSHFIKANDFLAKSAAIVARRNAEQHQPHEAGETNVYFLFHIEVFPKIFV